MTSGLIARLERAKSGSRDLDADIFAALGHRVKRRSERKPRGGWTAAWKYLDGNRWYALPYVTVSLEDAIRLVPAGWDWVAGDGPYAGTYAQLTKAAAVRRAAEIDVHDAATPTLALCIAALRAREVGQ